MSSLGFRYDSNGKQIGLAWPEPEVSQPKPVVKPPPRKQGPKYPSRKGLKAVNRIPQEKIDKIIDLYKANNRVSKIAVEVGVSTDTVRGHLVKVGIYDPERDRNRVDAHNKLIQTDEQKTQIIELYKSGMILKDIGIKMQMSASTIQDFLVQFDFYRMHSSPLSQDYKMVDAYKLLDEGLSRAEIARRCDVPVSTLRRYFERNPRGEA